MYKVSSLLESIGTNYFGSWNYLTLTVGLLPLHITSTWSVFIILLGRIINYWFFEDGVALPRFRWNGGRNDCASFFLWQGRSPSFISSRDVDSTQTDIWKRVGRNIFNAIN